MFFTKQARAENEKYEVFWLKSRERPDKYKSIPRNIQWHMKEKKKDYTERAHIMGRIQACLKFEHRN